MTKLAKIYLALKDRIKYYKSKNYSDKKIEFELRLDIENVIDLLAKENNITLDKNK